MKYRLTHLSRPLSIVTLACVVLVAQGCANLGNVEAFEKGYLAKEEMTFKGDTLESKFHEHIYVSKENASGGSGVGGGGCGCN
jgi:Domain of unknown function (DUF4266)